MGKETAIHFQVTLEIIRRRHVMSPQHHKSTLILLAYFIQLPIFLTLRGAENGARPAKPNIIIMMADDMGIGDTSAYLGIALSPESRPIQRTLRTPHIERLAQSGILFTDGYAPASMCSATRYSLLTGRFAHRSYLKYQGWLPHGPNSPMIQRELSTLPEMLQREGYRTACIGKYHVGIAFADEDGNEASNFFYHDIDFTRALLDGPTHHGFNEFFGVPGNTEDPLDTEPRVFIRNDRFVLTDRSQMKRVGLKKRANQILAAPEWDLRNLGGTYLREATSFIDRQSKTAEQPFFLYYVPNANHFQRNPEGNYAVPENLAGVPIKGNSRYSDDTIAGEREDMVLENDVALGKLRHHLQETEDPRWPGHKLIENTLLIFTSDNGPNTGDNLGHNQESGGLRGKKAKLWEGGIRVPFLVSWPAMFPRRKIERSIVTHTDLYATLASIVGHSLEPQEAQDSHDVLRYWNGTAEAPDTRPRVFFCHLGPPFLNDALAIRQGSQKLIVEGGLAMPWAPWSAKGARGASIPTILYDLETDLYEREPPVDLHHNDTAVKLADTLFKIHNRGYARDIEIRPGHSLISQAGWHNLRNDVTGSIGFEFQLRNTTNPKFVTHLGMWCSQPTDRPMRHARAVPQDNENDHPHANSKRSKGLFVKAPHQLSLHQRTRDGRLELGRVEVQPGQKSLAEDAFLYFPLESPIELQSNTHYLLLMTCNAADGDLFHDSVAFDGLSPLVHPDIKIERSVFAHSLSSDTLGSLPAFEDLSDSFSHFRLPVGPTLRFKTP